MQTRNYHTGKVKFLLKHAKKDSPVGSSGFFKQRTWQLRVCNWKELGGKAVLIKEMAEAQSGMASNVGGDHNCSLAQKPIIKEIRYHRIHWPHISDFETLTYNISMAKQNKAFPLHPSQKTTKICWILIKWLRELSTLHAYPSSNFISNQWNRCHFHLSFAGVSLSLIELCNLSKVRARLWQKWDSDPGQFTPELEFLTTPLYWQTQLDNVLCFWHNHYTIAFVQRLQ